MYQRTLELYYDQLVIGSDLSALSYCYVNKCPAIFMCVDKPYVYSENLNWDEDIALWNDLAYLISNDKFVPFSDKIVNIRIEDDKKLKVITKLGLVTTVTFNKLIISNDLNVEGLPTPSSKTNYDNWVIDWFNINRGSIHPLDIIEDDDDFVKKIYFYISQRRHSVEKRKDLVAVSKITDKNLKSDDYSQNIARLKVLNLMKKNGIKGIWDKSNNIFLKPKISSVKRDIYPLGKNIYNNLPPSICMLYDKVETILEKATYDQRWYDLVQSRYLWNK